MAMWLVVDAPGFVPVSQLVCAGQGGEVADSADEYAAMRGVLRDCCLCARACTERQTVRTRHWATACVAIAAWRTAPPALVHGCTSLIAGIVDDAGPGPDLTEYRGGTPEDAELRPFVLAPRLAVDSLFGTRFAMAHLRPPPPPPQPITLA